jgi:hypothetical protein
MKQLMVSLIAVLLTAGAAYAQGTVRVTAARANIRSAPTEKSAIVARVPAGTVFQLRSVQGDWYRVQLPGGAARAARTNAFISKKVSRVVGKAAASAAAPAPAPIAAPTPAAPVVSSAPVALPPPVPVTEPVARSVAVPAPPALAPVSRDGVSVGLQTDTGVTFLGASTTRVSRMLERLDSIPEFAKVVADEGSGAGASGTTPITYVWTIDAGSDRPIDGRRPMFAIQFKDIPGVSPDDLIPVIVRLSPTASNGRFVGAARGRADEAVRPGAEWDLTREWKQEVIRSVVEMVGRGAAKIQPAADLTPGEYAVVLRLTERKKLPGGTVLSQTGEGRLFGTVWAFSVR